MTTRATGPIYRLKGVTPKLGRGVFVAPNASVIGDVVIGDESSIWFGTVVRGDVVSDSHRRAHERPGQRGRPRHGRQGGHDHRRRRHGRSSRAHPRLHDRQPLPHRHGQHRARRRRHRRRVLDRRGCAGSAANARAHAIVGHGPPRQGRSGARPSATWSTSGRPRRVYVAHAREYVAEALIVRFCSRPLLRDATSTVHNWKQAASVELSSR